MTLAGLVVAPRAGWALNPADVVAPIQALNAGLVGVLQAGQRTPFRDRFHFLAPTIDRVFDLDGILRISIGPRWNDIDAAQQAILLKVFRRFTIATYVANFDSGPEQRFDVAPKLRAIGTDQVVSTTLIPPEGDKVRIDYVMRQAGAAWKVVDVLLDGTISRVAVQRSDFRALLASGDPAPLINSLKRKVVDLSGGTMQAGS